MDYFFAGETPTDGKPSTVGLEVSKNAINVTQVRKNMNLMFLFWCRQRDVDIIRYVAALLMTVQIDKFLHQFVSRETCPSALSKISLAVQITFPLNKISTKIVYKLVFK